jgi:hypothetical protein
MSTEIMDGRFLVEVEYQSLKELAGFIVGLAPEVAAYTVPDIFARIVQDMSAAEDLLVEDGSEKALAVLDVLLRAKSELDASAPVLLDYMEL